MWNRPSILVLLVGKKKSLLETWSTSKNSFNQQRWLVICYGVPGDPQESWEKLPVLHGAANGNPMKSPWLQVPNHMISLIISYVFLWNVHWNNMSLLEITEIWHAEISWCIMLYSWQPCGWMLGLRGMLHIIGGWHPLEGLYILVQVSLRISGESTPCKDGYIMF